MLFLKRHIVIASGPEPIVVLAGFKLRSLSILLSRPELQGPGQRNT